MDRRTRRASRTGLPLGLSLALVMGLLAPAPAAGVRSAGVAVQDADIRVVEADPAQLEVTVRSPKGAQGAGLLELEVRNRSRHRAEPLRFELTLTPARKNSKLMRRHVIQRTPSPLGGRGGRSIRAGGKESYWLPAPAVGDERVKWEARVLVASFFEGRGFERCPARLSELREGNATLRNECEFPLRVILRANPADGHPRLFAEDLDPEEEREIGAPNRPALNADLPQDFPPLYGPVEELEIVDWSVLCAPAEAESRLRMEAAHESLYRWPEPTPAVEGRVRYELEGAAWSLPRSFRGEARFTLRPGEPTRIESSRKLEDAERSLLSGRIGHAFAPLAQPAFEEWVQDQVFQRDQQDARGRWLYLPWPEAGQRGPMSLTRHVELSGGPVRRTRSGGVQSYFESTISHQPAPDGRLLIAEMRDSQWTFGREYPQELTRRTHDLEGPRAWVREYLHERYAGDDLHGRVQLSFTEVSFSAAPDREQPPRGEGAEALRAAWQVGYRYPEGMEVAARFTVKTVDQPTDWLARRITRGRLRFEGWTGGSPAFASAEVRIEGLDDDAAAQLASLFRARQSIWCRQDPAGRRDFDEVFAGAVIRPRPNQPGVFDLEHPRLRAARVRDGRVVGLEYQDGRHRRWEWSERHGRLVATKLEQSFGSWTSTIHLKWQELDAERGWLFPEEVEIEDWFGEGWGPEVYEFHRDR